MSRIPPGLLYRGALILIKEELEMKKSNYIKNLIISMLFVFFTSIFAQNQEEDFIVVKPMELSGPRIGATYLSESFRESVSDNINLKPFVAQFGWQYEKRFFTVKSGATAVTEFVALIGGFEQEKFLPSFSWLVGFRTNDGFELGAGPNLSLSGTAVVIAAGFTIQSGEINFPVNVSVATSKSGPRFSLLFGFNIRDY